MRDPIYSFCRELVPPSSVDKATSLSFTRAGASNLALARGNVLELYKITLVLVESPIAETAAAVGDDIALGEGEFDLPMMPAQEDSRRARGKRPQMHLVGRWALHGRIMDMQAVRGSRRGVENLLVAFAEAKMALVSYDAATQGIATESIHYYEHEQLQHATRNDGVSCALRADPEGRCVAMRIYGDQLAVLPLGSGSNQASSFVVDMRGAGAARGIRDCVFLAGYLAPTLALLHEPDAMWAGTLDAAADSCALTVVSLDLARRAVAPLSTVGRLPYDSRALVAVPAPIGGVLVLGAGAISHVANGAVACVAVLNRAAARGIGAALADCIDRASEGLGLVLDPRCCACVFVAPATAALWTQQGCCFLLTLASVGGRGVRRIIARQVAGPALGAADAQAPVSDAWGDVSVVPSCVAELRVSYDDEDSDGRRRDALLVFVGGTAGRSVLLEVIEVKRRQQQQQQQPMTMTMMDVDADFYGSGEPGESDQDALRLAVADELLGTGPAAALEVGVKAGGGGGDDESLELVTCAGNEWRGRLRVQQRHVAPAVVAALDVPGAPVRGVWTARCVAEYNIGGVMQAAASGADAAPALLGDRFLVVSRDASTAAFAISSSGDELSELDHRAGFFTRGATVAVAELRACTRVVQVHARGMRVVAASGRETQAVDVAVDADAEIVAAEVADPLVLLRLASGAYAAYEAAADSGELRPVPVPADALRRAVHVSLFRDAHRVLDARPANDSEADADAAIFTELGDSLYADDNDDSRRERKRLPAAKKAAPSGIAKNASGIAKNASGITEEEEEEEDTLATPLYAAVLHASGDLGIVRLPAFAPVWTARRFDCLPATLVNSAAGEEPEAAAAAAAAAEGMRIDQVRLALLGGDSLDSLHLVALTTAGELAVYRAFSYTPPSGGDDGGGCCALRFARVAHDVFAYAPEYERRVLRAQRRQLAAYAAWSEADKERLQERAADERLARERALEKQRREDAAAVADWGEDSDEEEKEKEKEIAKPPPKPAAAATAEQYVDDLYADADDSRDVFGEAAEASKAADVNNEANDEVNNGADTVTEEKDEEEEEEDIDDSLDLLEPIVRAPKLTVLENVGGYAAVFVTGARPALVLVGAKRYARVHPIRLPARIPATLQPIGSNGGDDAAGLLSPWRPVIGVARFHSTACAHGFVALGQGGTLTIATLPAAVSSTARGNVNLDAPWPTRCIPVGTAHPGVAALGGVAFHAPSATYAVAAASMARFYIKEPNPDIAARDAGAPTGGADQPLISEHERLDLPTTSVPPAIARFHVDLLSPVTWETVDSHALAANEHIVAMHTLTLDTEQAAAGCKPFLCLATAFVLGEDVASRGKMYVFDIVDIVPLPGRPQTNRKLRLLYQEEVRGAISALAELRGNLAVSLGSKVLIRSFRNNETLESVAFLDCQAWVRSLSGFKNFLLIGDLLNSLWFAGFQEDGPTRLQVLGRDFTNQLPVEFADFLINQSQLELVAADAFGCLHFFIYAPRDAHSLGGQKLLRRGEYNLRSRVTAIRRLVSKPLNARQQACVVATASGAVYAVSMLPEKTFKRLHRINTQLVHGTEPLAGLNPREFRSVPIHQRQYHAPRRTVLDADLLVPLFAHGSLAQQKEAAQRDGTTADRVLRDIAEIEHTVSFF